MYFFIEDDNQENTLLGKENVPDLVKKYLFLDPILPELLNVNPKFSIVKGNWKTVLHLPNNPIIISNWYSNHPLGTHLSPQKFKSILILEVSNSNVNSTITNYSPAGIVDQFTCLHNKPFIIGHKSISKILEVELNNFYKAENFIGMYSKAHKTLGPFLVEYFQAYQEMFPQYFEPDPEV